jgi:Outer membrane protein beta-barrel domain
MQTFQAFRVLFTTTLAAASLGCAAADTPDVPGWYGGIDGGATRETFGCEDTIRCDRQGSTLRLTLGRRLDALFSVQASYVNSRGTGATVDLGAGARVGNGSLKSSGWELAGLVHSPNLRGLSAYAKLGLASMQSTGSFDVPGFGNGSTSQRQATSVLGVGALYQVSPQLSLHAGYDLRRLVLDDQEHQQNAWVLGARLGF